MVDLYHRSIEVILSNQNPAGAYVACPSFPTYQFSWFRDGSFIAYSMDLAGQAGSAARFHNWAAQAINRRAALIERAVAASVRGERLDGSDILHTRYTLGGQEASGMEWPNFQLDGFGTWLWALGEHLRLNNRPAPTEWLEAAGRCAAYLAALWRRPCYDCWEEFSDQVHPYTLAAIYAGLKAYGECMGAGATLAGEALPGGYAGVLEEIRGFMAEQASPGGYFVKYVGSPSVDASLLGLAVPYQVVGACAPVMQATVERIERTLLRGGVRRYATDTYYGGGEWVLLAGWLGWYYAEAGQTSRALDLLQWIELQADEAGDLPEQVPASLIDPEWSQPWVDKWGTVARPLLWSHAMYVILMLRLGR